MNQITREIEVVENMILLLKSCLTISLSNRRKEDAKRTVMDIELCTAELQRLIKKKEEMLADEEKEKVKDEAV
jgi:hypothetical protein